MTDHKEQQESIPALKVLKYNFGRPRVMTWGWPVMLMSLGAAILFLLRCLLNGTDLPFPATSLVGNAFLMIIGTLVVMVFPAVFCARDISDRPIGHFTGIGTLFLSFLSGIPLMMIRIPLYNLVAYGVLRFSRSSIYPVFFHGEPTTTYGTVLNIITGILIPAFGAAIFFFGLLWSRFRSTDRRMAYVVIVTFFVLAAMDFTSILAVAAAGIWCCYLRSRVHNMWGPFLCLISMKLSTMLLPDTLSTIDIFEVQTYADVGSTYFYSSLPSFFMGMVLILFFIRVLDSFSISARHEINGTEDDDIIPPFDKSINLSLLLSLTVFIIIWALIFKGVYL
jgi:hypothetical protein